MLRTTLKNMLARKLRLLLSGLAVVLGVMFVAGSLVLTDTLGRSFDRIFADAYAYTDVQVAAEAPVTVSELDGGSVPALIPDHIVAEIAAVPGVAQATPLVEVEGARVIGHDGKVVASFGPPRFGVNWPGDNEFLQLREGRGPQAPDEIAIDAALAKTADLSLGDTVGVLTREPRHDFTLVGIFGFPGGRDSFSGTQFVAFTDQVAQQLMLGEEDVWNSVEVTAADGVPLEQLRDDIAAALGDGYQVRTGAELSAEQAEGMKEGLAFFNYILLGFAGVALFVGIFLILNTFSIIVAQRMRELALTRALGAGRGQIIASVLLEAVVVSLIASALGLAAGIGVGALLAAAAAAFVSIPLAGLGVPANAIIASFAVGILVTVIAATLPAIRASRVPPLAAMRDAATTDRPLTALSIAGGLVLTSGGALLGYGLTSANGGTQVLTTVLFGVLLTFIGVALLTPLAARPVVAVLGRLFSWSVPGKLGRLNSARNPRRTAITAAALMVGVALVTGVGVILDSTKTSISHLAEDNLAAELIISGDMAGAYPPSYDAAVLEHAAALPDVAAAAGLYNEIGLINDEQTYLTATNDLTALTNVMGLTPVAGTLPRLAPGQLVVDATTAQDRGLSVGDQVTVQLPRGEPTTYQIVGIYDDSALFGGFVFPVETATHFGNPQPVSGFVQLSDPSAVERVRAEISALLADSPEVSVTDRTAFIEAQANQLDWLLGMIQILLGLAILIAVLGIINTLALSVLERTRELGLLRAIGLSRAATMRMVTVESVVISLFGALLGVAVGAGLGAAVVRALRSQGIEQLSVPWDQMVTYLLLAALVGVIAAVLPAIRAARIDTLRAIAYE